MLVPMLVLISILDPIAFLFLYHPSSSTPHLLISPTSPAPSSNTSSDDTHPHLPPLRIKPSDPRITDLDPTSFGREV